MGRLVIDHISEATLAALQARAKREGRTVEELAQELIERGSSEASRIEAVRAAEGFRRGVQQRLGGKTFDAVALVDAAEYDEE